MVGIPDEPELTSHEWQEFITHPAAVEFNRLISDRVEICRAQLEAGVKYETIQDNTITINFSIEDMTKLQGECISLRWVQKILSDYKEVLISREKEKQNEGNEDND